MIYLQDIPQNYVHCFAGKDTCPKAATCLHAIAAQLLAESKESQPTTLKAVNNLYLRQLADLNKCSLYRNSEPIRYAKGMTHLFDDLSLKQNSIIRLKVMNCFSCESYFYRSRRGERLITPKEQQAIANVFHSAGLGIDPKFDAFVYKTAW